MQLNAETLNGAQVSDLFFNAEHPNFNAICAIGTLATQKAAIMKDAQAFVQTTGLNANTPEALAEDFMARL